MKNIIQLLILLLLGSNMVQAQSKTYKRLETGDLLPDIELAYTLNGKTATMRSTELRGKLILLDFWNIWCSACIAGMPRMLKLEHQSGPDFQVLLVTNNSAKQVGDHFNAVRARTKAGEAVPGIPPGLRSVIADTVLHQLFPHRSVPHHVWIGRDGRVRFIARSDDATPENVRRMLNDRPVDLALKKDTGAFNRNLPLYLDGNGRQLKNLKYYSMIYTEAGEWQNRLKAEETDTLAGVFRYRCLNFKLLDLFRDPTLSKNQLKFLRNNRLVLEVKDSSRFYSPNDRNARSKWRSENHWCYDTAIPLTQKAQLDSLMMADLNKFLPYTIKIEKRIVPCLALIRFGNGREFEAKGNEATQTRLKNNTFTMRNATIDKLISNGLAYLDKKQSRPIVDDTGYSGNISLDLSDYRDIIQVRKDLQALGLDLVEKTLSTEMLVIRDK
ncbi:hypothetical protein DBR40_07380 [Pedobacter sp. KBW01]|uniref:TlpA family protein disulfide reductase n=1 Tax=Pedobacter sp. KBW01 TaxID=2153364 RepID=UPI000F5A7B12|nr:TlpA disulfide reductase family protein [Pedobacter sp. KBW01]RQO77789.1 hypothetical protein DBR40_07380 [Pedobacter sp. KBW01]